MTVTQQALTVLVVAAGIVVGLSVAFAEGAWKWRARRRRVAVTDSNRALRAGRACVVRNADAATIALALGPYEAELADLQPRADALARHDRKDAGR